MYFSIRLSTTPIYDFMPVSSERCVCNCDKYGTITCSYTKFVCLVQGRGGGRGQSPPGKSQKYRVS